MSIVPEASAVREIVPLMLALSPRNEDIRQPEGLTTVATMMERAAPVITAKFEITGGMIVPLAATPMDATA